MTEYVETCVLPHSARKQDVETRISEIESKNSFAVGIDEHVVETSTKILITTSSGRNEDALRRVATLG